ncbi:alpha/beta hydrolase family protein [Rickettsia endosymbiont of Halotydeus destructor]|uniref:alpha/beta hydrolase family protein n=1 Tax=Rickettsia endosymbiont of Halotydeus destructor TaxID=2996754 RepID=UPI003BAF831C
MTTNAVKLFFISILLFACTPNVATRTKNSAALATQNNFQPKYVKGGDFVLTTYQRITDKNLPYVFYIEGDGHISEKYAAVSDNPTPLTTMLLQLAIMDNRPNIVYIARPCQYTPLELNPKCNSNRYWVEKRIGKEVVDSIDDVINNITNGQKFSLVGFSGGGGVAVMVAVNNKNVKDIITIAGNLDTVTFDNTHNGRGYLSHSFNPIDYAKQVNNIPQLHLSGAGDKRVPPFIAERYVEVSNSPCVKQKVLPNTTHIKGWETIWPSLLKIDINCDR